MQGSIALGSDLIEVDVDHAVADGSADVVPAEVAAVDLVDVAEATDLAELFRLLGDPTRIRILFAIEVAGELCVRDIAAAVDTTETKASQALRLLRSAGVVRNRRQGRNIYYRLDDDHVRTVLGLSRDHLTHTRADR